MSDIFKAYDIRGIYPSGLNEGMVYKIAQAYATLMQEENKNKKIKIVAGHDMRLSSPQLFRALLNGLTDQGADVVDIGLVSTPTFYFAVGQYGYDGGIQLSASHNPKEYNGLKLVRHHSIPVSGETGIYKIEAMVKENKFKKSKENGRVEKKDAILKEQVTHDLKYADVSQIMPFKIVADAANAMGALYLEELFKHLPCKLMKMNFELDGTFPVHQADPFNDETLKELKRKVVEERADAGIATDGDGDRIFFVDNNGETVPPSILRGLMAQIILKEHPKAKICYDIRPGKITREMIEAGGGIPIVTKVGHALIKEDTRKEGAVFAGESSGHYFLKMESGCYEVPMIVILKLFQMMSEQNKPLADIIKPYKKYFHSGEINSTVQDKDAKIKECAQRYSDAKISWLDGITVEYDDWWFNVRASNTEPLLRLNLEAKSKELMEQKTKEVLGIIRK